MTRHVESDTLTHPAKLDGRACAGQPPWWWFALPFEREGALKGRGEKGPRRRAYADHASALKVCASCPVVAACAEWAMAYEDYGTWGGLATWERAALGGRGVGRPGQPPLARTDVEAIIRSRFDPDDADTILALAADGQREGAA